MRLRALGQRFKSAWRPSIVQQWAGIAGISGGIALYSPRTGVVAAGLLVFLGGIGRELDERRH